MQFFALSICTSLGGRRCSCRPMHLGLGGRGRWHSTLFEPFQSRPALRDQNSARVSHPERNEGSAVAWPRDRKVDSSFTLRNDTFGSPAILQRRFVHSDDVFGRHFGLDIMHGAEDITAIFSPGSPPSPNQEVMARLASSCPGLPEVRSTRGP